MSVVKWECPGYPGNEQVFPCPHFQQHGFSVQGDFHTEVWPDWAAVPWIFTAPTLLFLTSMHSATSTTCEPHAQRHMPANSAVHCLQVPSLPRLQHGP